MLNHGFSQCLLDPAAFRAWQWLYSMSWERKVFTPRQMWREQGVLAQWLFSLDPSPKGHLPLVSWKAGNRAFNMNILGALVQTTATPSSRTRIPPRQTVTILPEIVPERGVWVVFGMKPVKEFPPWMTVLIYLLRLQIHYHFLVPGSEALKHILFQSPRPEWGNALRLAAFSCLLWVSLSTC